MVDLLSAILLAVATAAAVLADFVGDRDVMDGVGLVDLPFLLLFLLFLLLLFLFLFLLLLLLFGFCLCCLCFVFNFNY